MNISKRLKILIDILGLTLKDFSRQTGIPYQSLLNYLGGKREPNLENLQKIAIQTNCNLNWLLTGEGEMFRRGEKGELKVSEKVPIYNVREDPEIVEILKLLMESPQDKKLVLKLLKGKRDIKEALEGLDILKLKEGDA